LIVFKLSATNAGSARSSGLRVWGNALNEIAVTTREVVRHFLYKTGAYRALTWVRAKRGGGASAHLLESGVKTRFQAIYDAGVWRHGDEATPDSGSGSSLSATSTLRQALPTLLNELGAQTLLDVGCGDFTWMRHVNMLQNYVGVDVVEAVIEADKDHFENASRRFLSLDAIVDELPEADCVMCREILFHLSFEHIKRLIRNILSKNRSFIIATSDRLTSFNSDIPTGDFRLLNLEARPLKFPAPIVEVDDSAVSPRRILGVWDAKRLRERQW
jgi:hypothetical protein